jgi:LysM repeat protein
MDKRKGKNFFIAFLIAIMASVSACERSASSPLENGSQKPDQTQVLEYFLAAATETARAGQAGDVMVTLAGTATLSDEEMHLQQAAITTLTQAVLEVEATEPEEIEPVETEPTLEPLSSPIVITDTPAPTKSADTVTPTKVKNSPTPTNTIVNTPAPTLQVSVPKSYTLKKGEDVACIARRFDIDTGALLNTNGLTLYQYVEAGLVLTIPKNAPAYDGIRTLIPHPDTYTVQSNDTIYSIACQYGDIYPESIAQANGIKLKDGIKAGIILNIP